MAVKFNNKTKEYSPYTLPKKCILFTHNLKQNTACSQCGNIHQFGEMFTSKEIHNHFGLGYPVCDPCYKLEWERYNEKI